MWSDRLNNGKATTNPHPTRRPRRRATAIAVMAAALLLAQTAMHAAGEKTITVVCDWDFAPYEYINGKGESDGFCIEVLEAILNDLEIPHRFVMGSRQQAVDSFFMHKADLIVDYAQRYTGNAYCRSVSTLGYSNFALARNKMARPISRAAQLQGQVIAVNTVNDSIPYDIIMDIAPRNSLYEYAAREALGKVENDYNVYFLWGKEAMEWKIREYNLQNVVIDTLDFPAYEIKVVGYDQKLISDIDNQYARLQQSGKISLMLDKWMRPELAAARTTSKAWYVVAAVLMLALIVFTVNRITAKRVHKAMKRNAYTNAIIEKALDMGGYTVITNNLRRNIVNNQHGHSVPEEGITMQQMMERIHPDDREAMVMRRDVMRKLKGKPYPFNMRWNYGTADHPVWHNVKGFSYPEMGRLPIPKNIVIVSRDVTEELQREKDTEELTSRYIKMFDSSLIAMSFYDKNGNLINLNENMKKLCGQSEEMLKFFWATNLFDTDTFKDFNPKSEETFHSCSHMHYPAMGIDKYVEHRLRTILDDDGNLIYYTITARDITDERNMYLELQRQRKALDNTNKTTRRYERELRTLLENCDMYVWHADLITGIITFSRSLHGNYFSMTFDDYVDNIEGDVREEVRKSIDTMRAQASDGSGAPAEAMKPFNVTHLFRKTPETQTKAWFAVSGMSLPDASKRVKELFGVVRNVTTLMEAQQKLREETARAENSTMLKSTFLANMTHEIRTPLNAIVGFSDLLQAVDDQEERKQFISIIHNNCDMLMRLINDIFEASSLDIKPLAIVPRRVDFAKEFQVVCESLAQRVQNPAVKFIAEAEKSSFVTTLDMGRIQQVITNFVINAVKYTHEGHIRVGWSNTEGGLYIFCEDTGEGIPKEKQARVFDRFVKLNDFVQGTGLGLAICKSIAQGCGGRIGLKSEGTGCGCTFWIWVPCEKVER